MYWSGAGAGSSASGSDEGSLADDPAISAQYTGGSGGGRITPLVYNPESDGPPVFHSGVFTGDHGSVQFVQTADTGNQGTGEGDTSQSYGKSRARSWWGIRGWFLGDDPIDDGGSQVVQTADTGSGQAGSGPSTSGSRGWIGAIGDTALGIGSYVGRSAKSLILGDWTDEKPTGLSIGTGIGLGVIGVDLPMDLRDLGHTVTHPELSYKWGQTLAFNTIGLFPLIGVIKNAKNLKYLDDAGELAKRSEDAADAAGDAGRRVPPPSGLPSDPPPKGPSGPPSDLPKEPSGPPSDPPPKTLSDPSDTPAPSTTADGSVRFKQWKRGEPFDKPMPDGSAPSWDVVQSRYWKNRYEESMRSGEFTQAQLAEMRKGNAPMDYNSCTGQWERRELHHVDPQRHRVDNGPLNLRELFPDWHAEVDPFRHVPGIQPSRGIR